MARKVEFHCEDLPPELQEFCQDFDPSYPSVGEAYRKKVKDCKKLVGDEAKFRKAGCRRAAHTMVPGGRMATRGTEETGRGGQGLPGESPASTYRSPESLQQLLDAYLPGANPFSARTQSEKSYAAATSRSRASRKEEAAVLRLPPNRRLAVQLLQGAMEALSAKTGQADFQYDRDIGGLTELIRAEVAKGRVPPQVLTELKEMLWIWRSRRPGKPPIAFPVGVELLFEKVQGFLQEKYKATLAADGTGHIYLKSPSVSAPLGELWSVDFLGYSREEGRTVPVSEPFDDHDLIVTYAKNAAKKGSPQTAIAQIFDDAEILGEAGTRGRIEELENEGVRVTHMRLTFASEKAFSADIERGVLIGSTRRSTGVLPSGEAIDYKNLRGVTPTQLPLRLEGIAHRRKRKGRKLRKL